jgi:excisionase family DNA binding protein
MTIAEVAETLKLNQQTVRNWIDAGKLPAIHVGRRVRIKRSDFDRLIGSGLQRISAPRGDPGTPEPLGRRGAPTQRSVGAPRVLGHTQCQ